MAPRVPTFALSFAVACHGAAKMSCPPSEAWVHAWAEVEVVAATSCDAVRDEITARVNGQPLRWHDPHNNGTYSLLSSSAETLQLQRVTGNKRFTDKQTITLESSESSCKIFACSQSQGTSIGDFSTNYCNLRMLYCSVGEGCAALTSQYTLSGESVTTSYGAGKDPNACMKTAEAEEAATSVIVASQASGEQSVGALLQCIQSKCPMSAETMTPSSMCVLGNCGVDAGKCVVHSACRRQLLCTSTCTAPLAKTPSASLFLDVQKCMGEKCPGFPPSKSCVALHCSVQAAECAIHSGCRQALECADACTAAAQEEAPADMALDLFAEDSTSEVPVAGAMECISQNCPMGEDMSPSIPCVLRNCGLDVGKCAIHSDCRNQLLCTSRCTAPLAHNDDGARFLDLAACMREHCPSFPPSPGCIALHCGIQGAVCGIHSKCRAALMCANDCTASAAVLDFLDAANVTNLIAV